MEKIQHKNIKVNGINMHVAEIGEGPVVLFVHGFPELWYTRRHQMLYISSKGYRAIAPDLRGFGDSEAPPSSTSYTAFHVVGDLVCLLDSLGLDKVFLVGHDWGAIISWYLCLFRPDRIKALVNMSFVYKPRNSSVKPVDLMRHTFGDNFYICRFQVIISIFYYLLFFYIIRIIRLMIILCMHIPTKYVQRSDVFLRLS
ncbi:hypothetical protein Lser_V15G27419 [Lactuca serriola]